MENYQMNRPCGLPYNATCGMAKEDDVRAAVFLPE